MEPASAVADRVAALPRPLLLATDLDGVLAPIVRHPDESRLSEGILTALTAIASAPDVAVAVVSGRSRRDLVTFGFPESIQLVGSHGAETSRSAGLSLSPEEATRWERLEDLSTRLTDPVEGAWVEVKPASVVVHVREVDRAHASALTDTVAEQAADVPGVTVKRGHEVIELMARSADKGTALGELRRVAGEGSVVYLGDDVTDEDAFRTLDAHDLGIKVGDGPTAAHARVADPESVVELLRTLADQLTGPPTGTPRPQRDRQKREG